MSDLLSETAKILSELKRMHQLNYELIEQLNVTCQWIVDNKLKIPNAEKLQSLLIKSVSLMHEVQSDVPTFVHQSSRRKVTPFRTDEDETESGYRLFRAASTKFRDRIHLAIETAQVSRIFHFWLEMADYDKPYLTINPLHLILHPSEHFRKKKA